MTLHDEILEVRIKHFVEHQKEFDFPKFLTGLRNTMGITRRQMSSDLGIHEMKLFYLEAGKFKKFPPAVLLSMIANYCGIPEHLLMSKARKFLEDRDLAG